MKCRHLTISDEAYSNGAPAAVFLCAWPVSKLGVIPGWVNRQIGGGIMINHKIECPQCPCFESLKETIPAGRTALEGRKQ